ncbi:MAG TPA: alkaline phosphatase family protein [Paralcaligenes sp.]|jgi:phospholipase C
MTNLNGRIEHIVVLMLENRSFDSMLGALKLEKARLDGLSGNETNPLHGQPDVPVWCSNDLSPESMCIPSPDPGELWDDINMQLFGLDGKPGNMPPPMNGFVDNYTRQTAEPTGDYSPAAVMHYYTENQIPVLSALAKQFAVCDQWFASAPCQTWPNRFFLHTGTASGYENNSPAHFPYLMHTIFNRLTEAGKPWKIYFHDFPQSLTLTSLWPYAGRFRFMGEFAQDAKSGNLPAYSFIEPRYFPDVTLPNDQHPPHNVGMGESLIFDIYNAIRNAPTWKKTLFIITYDEHGGCYDHVPPPRAVPPDASNPGVFGFDRYGVRVPAVLISPYIKPNTILRVPPDGKLGTQGPPYPFDHTSIIATLRKCFDLGAPLTQRDAVAPDLESVLSLDTPDNAGPAQLKPLTYPMTPADIQRAMNAPLSSAQKTMHEVAAHLPPLGAVTGAANVFSTTEAQVGNMVNGVLAATPNHKTPAEALPFIKTRLHDFLGR